MFNLKKYFAMDSKTFSALMSIATTTKGAKMISVTLVTKPSGIKKGVCPFADRVTKVAVYSGIQFGASYENDCNAAAKRSGIAEPDYQAQKPFGKHYVDGYAPYLLESDKEEGKYYLMMYLTKGTHTEKAYFVDGRLATEEETLIIESAIPARKPCAKQLAYGIDAKEAKYPMTPLFESIARIAVDGKVVVNPAYTQIVATARA